jgi:TetR/AcrR family transcriptional regulator, mexCD-oprJ operon repressor
MRRRLATLPSQDNTLKSGHETSMSQIRTGVNLRQTTMSAAASRSALQQRVIDAILEAAAGVIAARGESASMSDVAAAAGVARATLYRYFPNRQALLDELASLAVADAEGRLAAARLKEVATHEGVTRVVRALVEVGDAFIVLARERVQPDAEQFEHGVGDPLRQLVERGQGSGDLRDDVPATWLTDALVSLVVSVLRSRPATGREDTIARITTLFLDGARRRSAG